MALRNPKVTKIAINAAGGAMTKILGTQMASKVDIIEDPAFNAGVQQGLTGNRLDPSANMAAPVVGPLEVWLPNGTGGMGESYEPITFGGPDGRVHGGLGLYVGVQGWPYAQLTTNSANAGGVLLREWD